MAKLNLIKKPHHTSHLSSCPAGTKIASYVYNLYIESASFCLKRHLSTEKPLS